jgi:flavodoxin
MKLFNNITKALFIMAVGLSFEGCSSVKTDSTASAAASTAPAVTDTASPSSSAASTSNTLIVYFSRTGNTKSAAETISKVTGGTLYEITPAQAYTDEDIDYNNSSSRTTIEQNDKSVRPQISGTIENWQQYTTVYIGYPIWWGQEPRIMDTFAESYDFTGKTVIPFCTSASSSIGSSDTDLKSLASNKGTWTAGKRLTAQSSETEIKSWITELGIQ